MTDAREVEVSCKFLVYRNRNTDTEDMLIGKRLDRLRRNGDVVADLPPHAAHQSERAAGEQPELFCLDRGFQFAVIWAALISSSMSFASA